jgi:hypothetical protein
VLGDQHRQHDDLQNQTRSYPAKQDRILLATLWVRCSRYCEEDSGGSYADQDRLLLD